MSLATTTGQYLLKFGVTTTPGTFGLFATRDETVRLASRVNVLTWTWPANLLANFSTIPANVVWNRLTLQRSLNSTNRPNPLVIYDVASRQAPVAEPFKWVDMKTWLSYAAYHSEFPSDDGTYSDPWGTIGMVCYRLILNFAKAGDPVLPPYGEMTWGTKLVVPAQPLSICSNTASPGQPACDPLLTGNDKIRLSWTAPDFTYWDTLTFISASHCYSGCSPGGGGWNRIDATWPPTGSPTTGLPTVLAYYLYSSTNNVSFDLRGSVTPGTTFWIPTTTVQDPSTGTYYFVRAVLASSVIDSNTVHVTY